MSETSSQSAAQPALPSLFELEVRDDSMAPLIVTGNIARFVTGMVPDEDGPPVLVVDAQGGGYIRKVRNLGVGHWEAVPLNPAFSSLDSRRDGLKIVAVMKGLDWF